SKVSLRVQHELRESALGKSLHNAHAEARCGAVERIQCDERFVGLCSIVVAQLPEIVLTKIGVNPVVIGAIADLGKVFLNRLWSAEVAEAQADHAERICNAAI